MKTETRLITPAVATQMLERNHGNRKLTENHVEFLSRQMSLGDWHFDGQPIRFTESGRLLDGQHRLTAIIRSGTSHEFLVVKGINSEAFKVMDTGKARSSSDIFSIEGINNSKAASSAILYILNHKAGFNSSSGSGRLKFSNTEILNFYKENPSMDEIIKDTQSLYSSFNRVVSTSIIAGMKFIMAEKSVTDSELFWAKVCIGVGLEKNSPMKLLRDKLTSDRISKTKMGKREKKAIIIKAWNLYRTGKTLKHLAFRDSNEKFPKIL